MRFGSKYPGFTQFCRHEIPEVRDPSGRHLVAPKVRAIIADFGVHRGEFTYHDPISGRDETVSDISGGSFDTVVAQEQLKWTDEEREVAEEVLMDVAENIPDFCYLIEDTKAAPPWGNYDEIAAPKVAGLALALECVDEALAYERENKNRPTVIKALEAAKGETPEPEPEPEPDDEDADALVAAVS